MSVAPAELKLFIAYTVALNGNKRTLDCALADSSQTLEQNDRSGKIERGPYKLSITDPGMLITHSPYALPHVRVQEADHNMIER